MNETPQKHMSDDSFCIVMLPDSQNYADSDEKMCCWDAQMGWIFRNEDKLNIRFVTHVGDFVNDDQSEEQLHRAYSRFVRLFGVVPFGMCAGNHDLTFDGKASEHWKKYFPTTMGEFADYWIDSYDDNKHNAQKIRINGQTFLFIHLAYLPSDGALEWASKILSENEDSYAIVTTHSFLIADRHEYGIARRNSRVSLTDIRLHRDGTNAGEDIYEILIKKHRNVRMVLSGHYTGSYHMELPIEDRVVHAILADYEHNKPFGGNGFLRIIQFVPSENKIYNYTYSPLVDAYKLGEHDSFVLPMNI